MPSTVVADIEYDAAAATLRVSYTSGQTYVYKAVPEKVYKELKASMVKGRYLQHFIKGHYEYEKL